MLLRLLTPRLHVGQRRPDEFAIHNASSNKNEKKIATPINSVVQSRTGSRKAAPYQERYALTR
jgi:hypothetical protein